MKQFLYLFYHHTHTRTHTQDSLCLHRYTSKSFMDTNEATFGLSNQQQMEETTDHV